MFFANSGSPHVRHWAQILDKAGVAFSVCTVHSASLLGEKPISRHFELLARHSSFAKVLAYLLLGLRLRLRLSLGRPPSTHLLHAHNTSGYGFAAWISGCPYIVTTYGSEIFEVERRGSLYRFFIRRILSKARLVTASSEEMADFLYRHLGVARERIKAFSMGVSPVFRQDEGARKAVRERLGIGLREVVFVYNRRIRPLYNTLEVIEAFRRLVQQNGSCRLILLEGDSDKNYVEVVLRNLPSRIIFVPGFIQQEELVGYLCASDYVLSVPDTDQMSSSILEAMACGCTPVLLRNPAYTPVIKTGVSILIEEASVSGIYEGLLRCVEHFRTVCWKLRVAGIQERTVSLLDSDRIRRQVISLYEEARGGDHDLPSTAGPVGREKRAFDGD